MAEYNKPLPHIEPFTAPFWEGTKRHELVIQKCTDCSAYRFAPKEVCHKCASTEYEWSRVSGGGTVYSYTIMRRGPNATWQAEAPYVVALVDLNEGARIMSHVVGCNPEDVKVGMKVRAVFEDITDEVSIYKFEPA